MSECRYAGRTEPRTVPGRHTGACRDETCPGCAPCPRAHCRVCGVAHDAGTCPECMAETREALREIGRLCDALPEEVENRGVEGEAMMLLGPVADIEARLNVETSYLSGRLPEGWIEAAHGKDCPRLWNEACTGCAGGELHPLTVLGTWDMTWRAELEHDEGGHSLPELVDYLDRTMGYMSTWPHVPFEQFAHDVRRCLTHLQSVLHDAERGVRANVPCFGCGADLERKLGKDGFADAYTCRGCRRVYTIAEYNIALRASLEAATKEPA